MPTMLLARIRAFMSSTVAALLAAAFFFLPSLPAHASGQVEILSKCPASWWAASQRFTASCTKEAACIKYSGTRTFQGIYVSMSGNQYCEYTDGYKATLSGLYPERGDISCPANATLSYTTWGQYPVCTCDDPYFTTDGVSCTTPTPRTVASQGGRTIKVGDGPVVFTAKVMQGTPKAGVMVLLYPHAGNFGGFTFEGTPYTDANGEVRIKYSSTWDLVGATREAVLSIACEGCTNRALVKMTVLGRPALQAQMCHRTEFPIELTSGTKLLEESDLQDAALHPLEFTRHYASRWDELPSAGVGTHWSHNHAHRVALGTEWRTVLFGDGTSSRFRSAAVPPGTGANWSCPSGVDCPPPAVATSAPATWQADGNADTMTDEGDRIVLRRLHDETVYEFEKSSGRLLAMRASNGWAYTYAYSGGQLARVSNAFGRSMTFQWDAAGRLARVVGADGNSVSFGFDGAARLAQATHSMGTSRSYLYEDTRWPNAVTGLVDERGQRWGNYAYDDMGRLSQIQIQKDGEAAAVRYLHNGLGQRVFKSEPEVLQTLPNEDDLGNSFVNWLRKNFGWLFTQAKSKVSLGTVYLYGDGAIPPWALMGEFNNGSANGKGSAEYVWLPADDGSAVPVAMYRNGKLYAIQGDHLGTPRQITDSARQVVWQWPYSGFGDNKPSGVLASSTAPSGRLLQWRTSPSVEFNLG
ncbi:DUF6531 domain-containing protein [Ramlibacter albus]|uniref:RHS repeat protein n=1 Tax=Ramlibacter albus TaxID=2079448 RepID=A0A923S1P5_9BURK|nr:DUF6531 domain-containing protein [Ramlibacter albus]MBC5764644.1 RHS repeat protein [Ramlibacter albus]